MIYSLLQMTDVSRGVTRIFSLGECCFCKVRGCRAALLWDVVGVVVMCQVCLSRFDYSSSLLSSFHI